MYITTGPQTSGSVQRGQAAKLYICLCRASSGDKQTL